MAETHPPEQALANIIADMVWKDCQRLINGASDIKEEEEMILLRVSGLTAPTKQKLGQYLLKYEEGNEAVIKIRRALEIKNVSAST